MNDELKAIWMGARIVVILWNMFLADISGKKKNADICNIKEHRPYKYSWHQQSSAIIWYEDEITSLWGKERDYL